MTLNIFQREISLKNIPLMLAPLCFLLSMIIIMPQQLVLESSIGEPHRLLSSIKMEYQAWVNSHFLMLLGIIFYLPAFHMVCRNISQRNYILGSSLFFVAVIGVVGIVGQLAIDFVYAVLSQQADLEVAQVVRLSIINNNIIHFLFNITANVGLLLAMFGIAFTSIITGWVDRRSGTLILIGWTVILVLHGKVLYIEAVGHGIILLGFFFTIKKHDNLPEL